MCRVYNTVGSLTAIKAHLLQNRVLFHSLNELIAFQENYSNSRQEIASNQRDLITEERNSLNSEVLRLENELTNKREKAQQQLQSENAPLKQRLHELAEAKNSPIREFANGLKALILRTKIKYRELLSTLITFLSLRSNVKIIAIKRKRLQYLLSHFEEAVKESSKRALFSLDRKKRTIDEIHASIYGAIGELKVAEELKTLSDEYILINDFSFSFAKAIYHSQAKEYIKSVQIDHLLISPSGLFLVETKNWSKQSWVNLSLRSPIQQIKRSSFALFIIASNYSNRRLPRSQSKIPIRNIIATTGYLPAEEFQYLKILPLNKLVGYIKYFRPSLSSEEKENLANYFLGIRGAVS